MRKAFLFILAFLLIFTMLPIRVFAVEEEQIHSYTPAVTAPACTEQGYTTYTRGENYENDTCIVCRATEIFLYPLSQTITPIRGEFNNNTGAIAVSMVALSDTNSKKAILCLSATLIMCLLSANCLTATTTPWFALPLLEHSPLLRI